MSSNIKVCSVAFVLLLLSPLAADAGGGGKDWYSAWGTSHNAAQTTPAMSGRTVRMLLMPSHLGNARSCEGREHDGHGACHLLRGLSWRVGR